jgi:hypothetical protein
MVVPQLPQNYTRRDRTNKHKRTITFRSRQIQEDRGQSNSKRCEPRPPKMQLFLEVAQCVEVAQRGEGAREGQHREKRNVLMHATARAAMHRMYVCVRAWPLLADPH